MPLAENQPQPLYVAGQGALFATPQGDPIPPSDVVRALEAIDPTLKIEWLNGAMGTSAFVLKQRWRENDPRWRRVQEGEYNPAQAFDVIGRFPREMRTGDMIGWLEARYGHRTVRDPRAEAERIIAEQQARLKALDEANVDAAVERGTQRILDESDHARLVRGGYERAHPMVHGVDVGGVSDGPKRLLPVQPTQAESVGEEVSPEVAA